MARPREFDENTVLDAAIQCFWNRGYEATSIKELVDQTGITAASLYNAYGDKHALFKVALDRYLKDSIEDRIRRCEALAPRQAISAFFAEILKRSLADRKHKGCLLVNSALEVAPHDLEFKAMITGVLVRIERFFLRCAEAGQADGTIAQVMPAEMIAQHLLSMLMGVRVLARVRPERALLEGAVDAVLSSLDPSGRNQGERMASSFKAVPARSSRPSSG